LALRLQGFVLLGHGSLQFHFGIPLRERVMISVIIASEGTMRPKKPEMTGEGDLFQARLDQTINLTRRYKTLFTDDSLKRIVYSHPSSEDKEEPMATIQPDASMELVELTDEQIDQVKGGIIIIGGNIFLFGDPGGKNFVATIGNPNERLVNSVTNPAMNLSVFLPAVR
jgi:hypothetical protein